MEDGCTRSSYFDRENVQRTHVVWVRELKILVSIRIEIVSDGVRTEIGQVAKKTEVRTDNREISNVNSRRIRVIPFIELDDEENEEIIKYTSGNSEVPMKTSIPLKEGEDQKKVIVSVSDNYKT